ncbi:zinc finger protein 84-like [Penaeus monodon]|uniref:zinc finger protein 84-like n=1 Tax=Penaeus monodon TaxID=6687 RepID=UPI0018A6EFB9|nr:zinc finger protein 84-like [Penaeus monodon]
MSFLAEWKPLAPATDEEIFSSGGSIKEEFTEYISEDTCFEIKEEQFDYADKEKLKDRDDILRPPLILDNYGNRGSSDGDQAMHKESRKEYTDLINNHIIVHPKEKPYSCEICNKLFSKKFKLVYHMRCPCERTLKRSKPYRLRNLHRLNSQRRSLVNRLECTTGEAIQCEICNTAFSGLVPYENTTNENPYSRGVCNKDFRSKTI